MQKNPAQEFWTKAKDVKNEVVIYLQVAAGLTYTTVELLDDGFDVANPTDWFGVAAVVIGFFQRRNAYGPKTFEREVQARVDATRNARQAEGH